MPYDNEIHHRRTIRLTGYDYSNPGSYFITICTREKQCIFGHIKNGEMILNEYGQIAYNEWLNTTNVRIGDVELFEFIIMPNHMHAIIGITRRGVPRTPTNIQPYVTSVGVRGTPLQTQSKTVGAIIRGYKSSVSKQIGKPIWQRNYYEHIIRDGNDYEQIRNYIVGNPKTWDTDKLYQKQLDEFNSQYK